MSESYLSRLIAHLSWADDRVLAALRSATNPDPSCREVFAHLLAAEHVWLARLKGERPTHPVWPDLSLEQCAALVQANQRALANYVDDLTPESLLRGVTYVNSAGREFTSSIEDILLHVALHGSYHRGQMGLAQGRQRADGDRLHRIRAWRTGRHPPVASRRPRRTRGIEWVRAINAAGAGRSSAVLMARRDQSGSGVLRLRPQPRHRPAGDRGVREASVDGWSHAFKLLRK